MDDSQECCRQVTLYRSDLNDQGPFTTEFVPYPFHVLSKLHAASSTFREEFQALTTLKDLLTECGNEILPITACLSPDGALPDLQTLQTTVTEEPIGVIAGGTMNGNYYGIGFNYYQVTGLHFADTELERDNRDTGFAMLLKLQQIFQQGLLRRNCLKECLAIKATAKPESAQSRSLRMARFVEVSRDADEVQYVWPENRAVPVTK